jgi:CheY-like chemotaxis protein
VKPKKRILVVDDEPLVLLILHDTLVTPGQEYEVVACSSGQEALDQLTQGRFDLLLTDLRMPDVSGIALTEAVRDQEMDTPVIWLTAYGSEEVREESMRLGVSYCLDKPVGTDRLLQIVREVLDPNQGGDEESGL